MKCYSEKIVVACGFLFIFVNLGLASTSFNIYQSYIVDIPGVGHTGGSAILSVRNLSSLIAMMLVNRYYDLLDVRGGVSVACGFTACGFVAYAFAAQMASLPLFVVGAVCCGIAYGVGGMVGVTTLMGRWFETDIGTAVGIASVGSGVASVLVPLVVVHIIDALSLSAAFVLEVLVALAIGLIVALLLRNRPSDVGMLPHGATPPEAHGAAAAAEPDDGEGAKGKPARKAKKSRTVLHGDPLPAAARRFLMLAMMLVGMVSVGSIAYLSVLFTTSGVDVGFAATLVSVAGLCLTISKFVTGELFDHLGSVRASTIALGSMIVAMLVCCVVPTGSTVAAAASAVLVGLGLAVGSVGISVWSLEMSDDEHRSQFVKNCQVWYAFGGFVMNTIPGPLHDLTGSYLVSYAIMATCVIIATVIILTLYRRYR